MSMEQEYVRIGDQPTQNPDVLIYTSPIKRGLIDDWDDMERVWNYTFNDSLQIDPKEHLVLITKSGISNQFEHQEKVMQIMFERFEVPEL